MSRNNVQRERLGRFPRAGTRSAVTPSVWASPSRRGPTTAWRGTSATCWATAAPAWRSESRACMKTWPGTPTGQGGQDGCRSKSRPGHYGSRVCVCASVCVFLSLTLPLARSFQRPHGAGRLRVLPPLEGRRLQGGRPHDARPAQRGHREGRGAVYRKRSLITFLFLTDLYRIVPSPCLGFEFRLIPWLHLSRQTWCVWLQSFGSAGL